MLVMVSLHTLAEPHPHVVERRQAGAKWVSFGRAKYTAMLATNADLMVVVETAALGKWALLSIRSWDGRGE